MREALATLRSHVDILREACEKGQTGTKTKRVKAVTAINELLSKKSVINALSNASRLEMMKGSQQDVDSENVLLAWAELVSFVVHAVNSACMDATSAKSVSRSGIASLRPEYMICLRSAIHKAIQNGPSGVIRHITPVFLYYSHQWLAEPSLRSIAADQIWQVVKEILRDEANRAMLTPSFIRTWVDVCFEQLTGRGPLQRKSEVVTSLASEVFQLLAKPVPSYDILTQSTRGVSTKKMLGGDYSYAIICERCCLMLVIADSLPRRDARELQATSFRTLTQLLQYYAVNVVGSAALESIINVSLRPILGCWTDRRYHGAAVSFARVLVLLSPNHVDLKSALRRRFSADLKDQSSSAILRAGFDVKDDFVYTAAACFSLAECLQFVKSSGEQKGHLILWLRVTHAIVFRKVLKNGTSILVKRKQLESQIRDLLVAITKILREKLSVRENKYGELMRWIARVIHGVCELLAKTRNIHGAGIRIESSVWEGIYQELWNHASRAKIARLSGADICSKSTVEDWFDSLVFSLSILHSGLIFDPSPHKQPRTGEGGDRLPYPFSRIIGNEANPSSLELEYLQNVISKSGIPEYGATHLREQMLDRLLDVSEIGSIRCEKSAERLQNTSCAVLGLSRGACFAYQRPSKSNHRAMRGDMHEMESLVYLNVFFSMNLDKNNIEGDGLQLCMDLRQNMHIWNDSQPGAHTPLPGLFDQDQTVGDYLSSTQGGVNKVHGRHFAVDPKTTRALEALFLSKLRNFLRMSRRSSCDRREGAQTSQGESDIEMTEISTSEEGFQNEMETLCGIKLVLVLSNYFLQGLELGVIMPSRDDIRQAKSPIGGLKSLLTLILQKLTKTRARFLVLSMNSALMKSMISVSMALMQYIESESTEKTLSCKVFEFVSLNETILEAITSMSRNLCELMVHLIEERTKKIVRRIEIYSSTPFAYGDSVSPVRRPSGRSSARKRRRLSTCLDEGHSFENRFSDEEASNIKNMHQGNEQNEDKYESSDDDSNEFIQGPAQLDFGVTYLKGNEGRLAKLASTSVIRNISEAIQSMIRLNRKAAEIAFEVLKEGIEKLNDTQLALSPDGFERSSLLSDIFDDGFLDMRQYLWNILLSVGTYSAILTAGEDILNLGKMWKRADEMSHKYVDLYAESFGIQQRKHYPLPQKLEFARILYLEYSRMFIMQCGKHDVLDRLRHHAETPDCVLPRLLAGIMTTVDHFRSKHAFRMPRVVRTSYLMVGVAFMEMMSKCFESLINTSRVGMSTKMSDLGKVLNSTKNAVLKFLSDPDGSVRVLAAHFVPRLLGYLHFKSVLEMETFVQSFLPDRSTCLDHSSPYIPSKSDILSEETEEPSRAPWDLTAQEHHAHNRISKSFSRVGSTSKGFVSILSLAEAAMVQEALIPFFYVELFGRVMENSRLHTPAYFAILRLCGSRCYESPKRVFQLFVRVILHRWLRNSNSIEMLYKFPVFLTLDCNHHMEGIRFDWMREHLDLLIPYFLIHESQEQLPGLTLLSKLANDLGTSASLLLSENVPSFSLIYPMHFIDSMHATAGKLWSAIDACVGGNSRKLMNQNNDSVMAELLRSIYTNDTDNIDTHKRANDIAGSLGFFRDATKLNPPLYDPLVIALSINQLHKSNTQLFIMSGNVLKGSIFAEVRSEETGKVIANDFSAFVKECQRKTGTLLRLLLTISKFLLGVPPQQPSQNRRDAFFCLGVLWRMIGITVLTKSVSERKIFYMLVAKGFEHRETVLDAAWLLQDVQRRVAKLNSDCPSFSVSVTDLSSDPDVSEHLSQMTSSQERGLYELLSGISPVLVSLLVCSTPAISEQQKTITSNALKRLVSLCAELEAWPVIVANGPFPTHSRVSHVRKLYHNAKKHMDSSAPNGTMDKALKTLNRSRGILKLQRTLDSPPCFLACLQELNTELTDIVLSDLSRRVRAEAWVRSCGMECLTAPRISDVISCTLDLTCTTNDNKWFHSITRDNVLHVHPTFLQAGPSDTELRDTIRDESAKLLSKLGLLHLYSTPISSRQNFHRKIAARSVFEKYEDVRSGKRLSIFVLQKLLTSGAPVRGLTALETLKDILQNKDGRSILEANRNCLETIYFLRGHGKAPSSTRRRALGIALIDPLNGDKIWAEELPGVTDVRLWSRNPYDFIHTVGLDKWVRTFCAAFACACQSKEMQALSSACFASYELSCQMMPYLLMDSICDLDTERLSVVSGLLSTHVLNNPEAPKALRRLFVHALDVLCQIGLAVAFKDGVSHWFQKTDKTYPCYYVFEIPYEQVAAAALESKAYFSAIRFAQLYINQEEALFQFGCSSRAKRDKLSNYGEDAGPEEKLAEAQARVRPIVCEAMKHISEPDSRTAFYSSKDLTTLVANVASFNNEWATALGALEVSGGLSYSIDGSLNSESPKHGVRLSQSGIDFAFQLNREVQKFKCFIGMGTLKVACAYWEDLRRRLALVDPGTNKDFLSKHGHLFQELNDMRYAAAWKLQQWESPKVISTQNNAISHMKSSRKSFHEAIHTTLHSLCGERYADAFETLVSAKNSLLSNMVEDIATVSASSVRGLAAQLRVLEFLDRRSSDYAPNPSIDSPIVLQGNGARNNVDGTEPMCKSSTSLPATRNWPYSGGISKATSERADYDLLLCLMDIETSADEEKFFPLLKAFDTTILTAEIPSVLFRCLRKKSNIALASAATSTHILSKGGAGCWARAASCLGTLQEASLQDAETSEIAAWKLQDARLRWYSNHDACSRRQALDAVKTLITNDLCGESGERRSEVNDEDTTYNCVMWLSSNKEDQLLHFLRVEACNLAAIWSLDMRTHEPIDLYKLYLESGLRAAQQARACRTLTARAHFAMASFANEQIRNIDLYKKGRTYEKMLSALKDTESKVERMKDAKEGRLETKKLQKLKRGSRSSRSQMSSASRLSRELDGLIVQEEKKARIERERLEKLARTYRKWQLLACKHFAACLREGTAQDLRVAFRMVAIWLDSGAMRDAITGALISSTTESQSGDKSIDVPASKLLPLAPQLMSRLGSSEDMGPNLFQNVLEHTIVSMTSDFPAHCLWQLLALTNSTRRCTTEKFAAFYKGDKGKKEAAESILRRLPQSFESTLSEMKKISEAYIALSEMDPKFKPEGKRLDLKTHSLLKLGEVRSVPIPTIPLPICADDHVDNLPLIQGFGRYATVFSGLSRPLNIICIGSDGHRYPQIVKGRDDLRGDAAMEQMFMIVNKLLQKDHMASGRNLSIRTYRIIPLSPFSGIIQFVDNTKPLKAVLVEQSATGEQRTDRKSLHERYRPKDLKHRTIWERASKAYRHDGRRDISRLKKYLRSAWPKFQPVFRHFFIEQWPDPEEWFQHQLNYSRSVAVMSIVGFIIGLGDRHLSNILMDVRTAEFVHIDFGISFELGKLLPTPELMPFRLTRDIVDGFGIAGVEGVFRRSCEITLQVLRQNKDLLLTVIDVLLHDPMFTWALTPVEVLKEQEALERGSLDIEDGESSKSFQESDIDAVARKMDREVNGSRDAQRAMSRISEKLDGLEGTERLSVETHVARLIDEARAFHVIGAVYPGWMPWV
ncbi:Phosphatidylinositol 3-/4-kinase [Gracilaria domingensis]|nr:Phosphatidylinositol 3-/4-kinase [Gracilaria domingensis]